MRGALIIVVAVVACGAPRRPDGPPPKDLDTAALASGRSDAAAVAPIAAEADAGAAMPDELQHPPAVTGPSITLEYGTTRTLDDIKIGWAGREGGTRGDGTSLVIHRFALTQRKTTEDAAIGEESTDPLRPQGEIAVFGEVLVFEGIDHDHFKITHTGKALADAEAGDRCSTKLDETAAKYGLHGPSRAPGEVAGGTAGGGLVPGIDTRQIAGWILHCGEQTGRIWITRQPAPAKRAEGGY